LIIDPQMGRFARQDQSPAVPITSGSAKAASIAADVTRLESQVE
jgi:hypothetical protein